MNRKAIFLFLLMAQVCFAGITVGTSESSGCDPFCGN